MSNLSDYIEKTKKYCKENNFSETEIIRYVYLDLGNRFSFNQNFFAGNSKTKKSIYNRGKDEESLNEAFTSKIAICKSISYILEKILKELNINIKTIKDPDDSRYCAHVYNIITPKNGKPYVIDLQEDLKNIQSHSFTKNFGLSVIDNGPPVLKRFDIEQIDKKLGYIKNDNYYSDDYLYLMKSTTGLFDNLAKKAEFVLKNLDIYNNPQMQYPERYWHHEKLLKTLFSEKERRKMAQVNCYRIENNKKVFQNCIYVETPNGTDIYLFSINDNCYLKYSLDEFAEMVENGLQHVEGIPGLKRAINDRKNRTNLYDEK